MQSLRKSVMPFATIRAMPCVDATSSLSAIESYSVKNDSKNLPMKVLYSIDAAPSADESLTGQLRSNVFGLRPPMPID